MSNLKIENISHADDEFLKLVGRDGYEHFESYIKGFTMYFKGIDDIKSIGGYPLTCFTNHLNSNNPVLAKLTVKEYRKYLPDIKHFVKYGHLCASRCANECTYCCKCAEKMQARFRAEEKAQSLKTAPVCIIEGK